MIKNRNIANDAQIELHKIVGNAGMLISGEIFWVGTSGTAAYNQMRARIVQDHLFTSIDTANNSCVASRGDVIAVLPGHVETVIAAGGLDLDVKGVTVVFLGKGTDKAYVTFTTDVSADMDIDAANVTLINPKFVAGVDSLTGPIDVNSTDFKIINGEWHDATDVETTDCIIATSGATRLCIDGWKFFCGTETADQKQSHIQINGCDDIVLKNIDIRGNFYVGCIENVTDAVLNARFEDMYLENLNATPKPALYLDANATGSCRNVKLKIYSGSTYASSVGKMSWDAQCEGFMGDGVGGDPIGTLVGSSIEGQVSTISSKVDSVGTAASTATSAIQSVGIQTSTVDSRLISTVASIGTGVSVAASSAQSVGIQTSTVDSKLTSAATSVGTGVSIAASSAQSVGVQASTLVSQLESIALIISVINSKT